MPGMFAPGAPGDANCVTTTHCSIISLFMGRNYTDGSGEHAARAPSAPRVTLREPELAERFRSVIVRPRTLHRVPGEVVRPRKLIPALVEVRAHRSPGEPRQAMSDEGCARDCRNELPLHLRDPLHRDRHASEARAAGDRGYHRVVERSPSVSLSTDAGKTGTDAVELKVIVQPVILWRDEELHAAILAHGVVVAGLAGEHRALAHAKSDVDRGAVVTDCEANFGVIRKLDGPRTFAQRFCPIEARQPLAQRGPGIQGSAGEYRYEQ